MANHQRAVAYELSDGEEKKLKKKLPDEILQAIYGEFCNLKATYDDLRKCLKLDKSTAQKMALAYWIRAGEANRNPASNLVEVARILEVHPQTIRAWRRDPKFIAKLLNIQRLAMLDISVLQFTQVKVMEGVAGLFGKSIETAIKMQTEAASKLGDIDVEKELDREAEKLAERLKNDIHSGKVIPMTGTDG